jgi:DNA-binding MurR/RpiR family transcriptional regulator
MCASLGYTGYTDLSVFTSTEESRQQEETIIKDLIRDINKVLDVAKDTLAEANLCIDQLKH